MTRRSLWFAAAVVLAVVAVVGVWLVVSGDDDDPQGVRLSDGRIQVTETDGDVTAILTGPDVLRLGETARYDVDVTGTTTWVVGVPDQVTEVGVDSIEVVATETGHIEVRLAAVSAVATIDVEIIDP